jgi:hypothetical protein
VDKTGGAWCPKQQVERGVREYLQVDLSDVYVLTGVETQGRYDRGRGQEYAEEYMIEYWRPGLDEWKQYSRWDGKQVSAGTQIILWYVDPLQGKDREISNYTKPLLGNGSAKRHERNSLRRTVALQQRSGVFYVVRIEML